MIGTTLSGVTFISIPGEVGNTHWTYLALVAGNCVVLQAESGFHLFMAGLPFRGESPVDGVFFLYRVAVGGGFVPLVFGGGRVAVGFF